MKYQHDAMISSAENKKKCEKIFNWKSGKHVGQIDEIKVKENDHILDPKYMTKKLIVTFHLWVIIYHKIIQTIFFRTQKSNKFNVFT